MRIYEITDDNAAWLKLHEPGVLSVGPRYFAITNIYERAKTDKSLLSYWKIKTDEFYQILDRAFAVLDGMPDQNDNFVRNIKGTLQNYKDNLNKMDSDLQSLH